MEVHKKNRPHLLEALCSLTFAGSSLAFIGYFLASLFFEKTSGLIIKYSSASSVENISPLYFTGLMALYSFSLVGAIRMWKLHRDGFFVYTVSQLLILFYPAFWMNREAFSQINAVFTIVFILGYAFNYRALK